MKIGFLASYRGKKQFDKEHRAIVAHLQKRGHEVLHNLDLTLDQLLPLSYADREKIFMGYYKKLEECDLVIAECTIQSTQVGFGFSYLRSKGKPVVLIAMRDAAFEFFPKGEIYSSIENVVVYQYSSDTIGRVLDDALMYMGPHVDKRFTIIFPAHLLAKVEEVAQKKKLPKAVYIRQLIEKDLTEQDK